MFMLQLAKTAEGLSSARQQHAADLTQHLMVLCHLTATQPQLAALPAKAFKVLPCRLSQLLTKLHACWLPALPCADKHARVCASFVIPSGASSQMLSRGVSGV